MTQIVIKKPGIKLEEQELLFQKFQRLSAQPTGGESSTGLGLYITKLLVDQLHGSIDYKTEEGKGTRFVVNIPIEIEENLMYVNTEEALGIF